MSYDTLGARLMAAEKVCILYGRTPTRAHDEMTDAEKALFELWAEWFDGLPKDDPVYLQRDPYPGLAPEDVERLARKRDATRAATLKHFFGDGAS